MVNFVSLKMLVIPQTKGLSAIVRLLAVGLYALEIPESVFIPLLDNPDCEFCGSLQPFQNISRIRHFSCS
jgi:hypothetical protein